jgi:hypothetical protein
LADLKISEIGPGWFSKLSVKLQEIYYPVGAKDVNLPALLWANGKAFDTIQKRTYYFNMYKIKGALTQFQSHVPVPLMKLKYIFIYM